MDKNYTAQDRLDYRNQLAAVNHYSAISTSREKSLDPCMAMLLHGSSLMSDQENSAIHDAQMAMQSNPYRRWLDSPTAARQRLQLRHRRMRSARAA